MQKNAPTFDDLLSCEGMQFSNRMKIYSFIYHCFEMNMRELIKILEEMNEEQFALKIWTPEESSNNDFLFQEVARRFHNMVASAKSLVDHTRIFVNEHYKSIEVVESAYLERVKNTFSENGNAAVIEDLRNYFLHAGVPPLRMQLHLDTTASSNGGMIIKNQVFLEMNRLRSWGRWKSRSKKYLAELTDDLDLLALVSEYKKTVNEFHMWFSEFLREYHAEDTEKFYAMDAAVRGVAVPAKEAQS